MVLVHWPTLQQEEGKSPAEFSEVIEILNVTNHTHTVMNAFILITGKQGSPNDQGQTLCVNRYVSIDTTIDKAIPSGDVVSGPLADVLTVGRGGVTTTCRLTSDYSILVGWGGACGLFTLNCVDKHIIDFDSIAA